MLLRKLDEEFDRLCAEMSEAFVGSSKNEVEALVDEIVKAVREQHRRT